MSETMVTNGEKREVMKPDIYREFILWTAMPPKEKERLGLESQKDFCEYYKIGVNTPTRWKERNDFEPRVDAILKMWSTDKTPDVVQGIYRAALKGNPMSQLLWLQYFKKFNPKADAENGAKKVELSVNDIRFLIETLPEQLKEKHYANLRELLDDSAAVANAISDGEIPDGIRHIAERGWSEESEDAVSEQTYHDAQFVPGKRADEIPRRYTSGVCSDMEWQVSQNNNQSAARGW